MHSTNYTATFISVADDCAAGPGRVPPHRETPTVARMQYEMISENPYHYTSDEIIFAVHARKQGTPPQQMESERIAFFSKGQACLRASPLAKSYGWGIHHDQQSRVAIHPVESDEYERLCRDPLVEQVRAMRSSRKG
jgi:hypothetical protein